MLGVSLLQRQCATLITFGSSLRASYALRVACRPMFRTLWLRPNPVRNTLLFGPVWTALDLSRDVLFKP
ncbi:hypothetical protein SAMN04515618_11429 [Collimonas sp. OK307]|nr:hypothetical protein SAMN04515618_11429 [Collimonas sp. OK307]